MFQAEKVFVFSCSTLSENHLARRIYFHFPLSTERKKQQQQKKHNLKVENYVLFRRLAGDLSPEDSKEPGYIGVFAKKNPGSWNTKRLLLIKEKTNN